MTIEYRAVLINRTDAKNTIEFTSRDRDSFRTTLAQFPRKDWHYRELTRTITEVTNLDPTLRMARCITEQLRAMRKGESIGFFHLHELDAETLSRARDLYVDGYMASDTMSDPIFKTFEESF